MTGWDVADLSGPDGEDWRVPVSELAARQQQLAERMRDQGQPGVLIQHPVDLYYFAGGRQNASMFIPAAEAGGSGRLHSGNYDPEYALFPDESRTRRREFGLCDHAQL